MTSIGILGSGRVATALAAKLASTGHEVTVGSRNPADTAVRWTGPTVRHRDHAQTARHASIVINATPGDTTLQRIATLRGELDGKILVDVSNATVRGADGLPGGLCYPNSSLAEHLQQALPATRVVKTLNTMLFTVMTDPHSLTTPPTAFLSGDDEDAKAAVGRLLVDLGWRPEWIEDLGDITTARATESLVLLVPHLFRRHGPKPFALTVAR
ncbi:NADPH-dependent F420 reductase [Streptantibioticus ferralitis]|uniref:NAD(P)-binding domain-containing protein n=1 Tax=Streptantibioticus ferralitis TaxID=236510 RepID=A0ABT5YU36_9ACTN|nr:NAD(P)-binding domain-containing protein [Streptantibioticus ferralitis]MDF2255128.1 NAD(P)-binding domain-containing protein [Streptantibioticus ferralitis]